MEHIDPFLCTHLIYSFVGINSNGTVAILDPWLDLEDNWGLGTMRKFNELKLINPKLKTLVAVGGWNEGSQKFSNVAQSSKLRLRFAKDAADLCLRMGFDGLDVDWEYPGQRDGDPSDRENFVDFLSDLKQEFSSRGLLLTAAVAATENSAKISYNISEISNHLDFINLMAYDLHGPWESVTGHNAPLFAGPNDSTELKQQLNVLASVSFWLSQGAPAEKLNLGVAFYGRSFTLRNASENRIGSPASGPGTSGPYTYESGFLGYNEVCEKLQFERWNRCWDSDQQVPYAYSGNQWVGYDDPESVELKATFIKQLGLAGGMVWSIETDDFLGKCGETFALLSTLNRVLGQDEVVTTTTISSSTSTINPLPTTTTQSSSETTEESSTAAGTTTTTEETVKCVEDGYFRDPGDCSKFFICQDSYLHSFQCPAGLYFDLTILSCNYPDRVDCEMGNKI